MAATRLTDLVIASDVMAGGIILESLTTSRFVQSNAIVRDPELDTFLNGQPGGPTVKPRMVSPLDDDDDANVSSDDPESSSTPSNLEAIYNLAVRQSLNKSWSEMDLAVDLNGDDPMAGIQSRIAAYWTAQLQKRAVATCRGIFAENVASWYSDMVIDISGESGVDAYFNASSFIDAKATMGDRMDGSLAAIAVHSVVYATMLKNDLIDYVPASDGKSQIPTYQGAIVIVDDRVDVVAGTPTKYYTYLFGPGAIALGVGSPKVPFEIDRTPAAGNGGGQETVYSRVEYIIHPQGYQCSLTSTPTLTQLRTAGSWTRAYERKRIPLACLITAG